MMTCYPSAINNGRTLCVIKIFSGFTALMTLAQLGWKKNPNTMAQRNIYFETRYDHFAESVSKISTLQMTNRKYTEILYGPQKLNDKICRLLYAHNQWINAFVDLNATLLKCAINSHMASFSVFLVMMGSVFLVKPVETHCVCACQLSPS